MRRWHLKLMRDSSTTDVLSISQLETTGNLKSPNPYGAVGDIMVCLDEAKRQAKKNQISTAVELGRYITHGLLHCLGYDDVKRQDRQKMWKLQEKLVKKYKFILCKREPGAGSRET